MAAAAARVPWVAATLGGLGVLPFAYYAAQHDRPDAAGAPRLDPWVAEAVAQTLPAPAGPAVAAVALGQDQPTVRRRFLTYAATILAFMGGVQWGLAVAPAPAPVRTAQFAVSVLPSLVGWAALNVADLATSTVPHAVLGAGFAGLYVYDRATVMAGRTPYWYLRLRTPLTAAVLGCTAVAAALGSTPRTTTPASRPRPEQSRSE
jgi:hypothetical protein